MSENLKHPDFIQIPRPVLIDKNIQSSDKFLFGYLYWFCKLSLQKCIASNETLAELTGSTVGSIKNSLSRLETAGFIKRLYHDDSKNNRAEIIVLVEYGIKRAGSLTSDGVSLTSDHNKNINTLSKDKVVSKAHPSQSLIKRFEKRKGRKLVNVKDQLRAATALLRRQDITYRDVVEAIDWVFNQEGEYAIQVSDLVELQKKWNKIQDLMGEDKPGTMAAFLRGES